MFPLHEHTIFLTLAGSQAHGTARPGSDVDLRGVCIAPLSVRLSLFQSFEQYEGSIPDGLKTAVVDALAGHATAASALDIKAECVIYDIAKFVRLCAAANPNALEILFADRSDWVLETDTWMELYGARHLFLTKALQQTFVGYAMAQLKRIKTHRSWLLSPPETKPTRERFGLPNRSGPLTREDQNRIEQSIAEKVRSYHVDDLEMPAATRIAVNERFDELVQDSLGVIIENKSDQEEQLRALAVHALTLPADVVATLTAEKKYRTAMKHWNSYQTWKTQRNQARAELEATHGYDTKHAMHLIRLLRMGLETLETGELRVRRPDAAELLDIRDGSLSHDALIAMADELHLQMKSAVATSPLPADVDNDAVDALTQRLILRVADGT